MVKFFHYFLDSVKYGLSDTHALIVISTLMTITSIINKNEYIHPIFSIFTVSMFFAVGYGSFISWYTINGSDEHPKIHNIKPLFMEGLKKSFIMGVYSIGITFFFYHFTQNLFAGNIILSFCFVIPLIINYVFMIGGCLNRYLNGGALTKAFNIVEIAQLIVRFDFQSFINLVLAVSLSHLFAISVVLPFDKGFSSFEFYYSISTFFLAPFLFIAIKRFVAFYSREVLERKIGD